MKKILMYLSVVLSIFFMNISVIAQPPVKDPSANKRDVRVEQKAMGQQNGRSISNIPECFCCDGAYNMTPPVISGPDIAKCGTTASFTWPYNCTGVVVGRNFSPLPPGTVAGGNNNSAFINIPAGFSGSITLTVTYLCGNKSITSQKTFKVECCECKLPATLDIIGPRALCLSENCADEHVYTVPSMNGDKCYTYNWNVSPAPTNGITGQGTNTIKIKCKDLRATSYTIVAQIKCGDKVVNSTATIIACQKPKPIFAAQPNPSDPGSGVLVPGTTYSNHFWYIVTDNDNSGDFTTGDTFIGPLSGNSANFSNLQVGKRYVFYHFVMNQCDGFACWSSTYSDYRFNPSTMRIAPNGTKEESKPVLQKLSEKTINQLKDIPKELLNKLPADKVEMMKKSEYVGHVTLLK